MNPTRNQAGKFANNWISVDGACAVLPKDRQGKPKQGHVVLLDEDVLRKVIQVADGVGVSTCGYARLNLKSGKRIWLHRWVANADKNQFVDHKNHNPLDNRRSNLRLCTCSQNQCNRPKQSNNTSGFKGVSKNGNRWGAKISYQGVTRHLGTYASPELAHYAYVAAAKRLHSNFACIE